jgi:hypothetical protein
MHSNFEKNRTSVFCILISETTGASAFILPHLPQLLIPAENLSLLSQVTKRLPLLPGILSSWQTITSRFVDILKKIEVKFQ